MRVRWAACALLALACGGETFTGSGAEPAELGGGSSGEAASAGSSGRKPQAGRGGADAQAGDAGRDVSAGDAGEAPVGGEGGSGEPEAGRGGAGAGGSAGTAGVTEPSGAGGESTDDGGTGGEAGGECQPTPREIACESAECGQAVDGCGGKYVCGECEPQDICEGGECHLRNECDCSRSMCGTTHDCPVTLHCENKCPDEQAQFPERVFCFAHEGGDGSPQNTCAYAPSPEHEGCYWYSLSEETCCAEQEPECRQAAYGDCSTMIAINERTGEECGSCEHPDLGTLRCGPGWLTAP